MVAGRVIAAFSLGTPGERDVHFEIPVLAKRSCRNLPDWPPLRKIAAHAQD